MKIFADQIAKGESSSETVPLAAYGIYLMNGGRKEDFKDMTLDDIQLIYATYNAYQSSSVRMLTEAIAKMFGGS